MYVQLPVTLKKKKILKKLNYNNMARNGENNTSQTVELGELSMPPKEKKSMGTLMTCPSLNTF
jgi:hypothetical protein